MEISFEEFFLNLFYLGSWMDVILTKINNPKKGWMNLIVKRIK